MRQCFVAGDRYAVGADAVDCGRMPGRRYLRSYGVRIAGGLLDALLLHGGRSEMRRVHRAQFFGARLGPDAAFTTGIADTRATVHCDRGIVDIGDVDIGDVDHGAIIADVAMVPVTAFPAVAVIAMAIVDPAVPAHFAAPIPFVEAIGAIIPAPPSRSPHEAGLGWQIPVSGNPVIIVDPVAPRPISGNPDIVGAGQRRLIIDRQRRRRIADADVVDADIKAEETLRMGCRRGQRHSHCGRGDGQRDQRSPRNFGGGQSDAALAHGNDPLAIYAFWR